MKSAKKMQMSISRKSWCNSPRFVKNADPEDFEEELCEEEDIDEVDYDAQAQEEDAEVEDYNGLNMNNLINCIQNLDKLA